MGRRHGAMRRTAGRVAAAGLLGLAGACGTNQHEEAGPVVADTARGVVEVAGAEPLTRVVLRTPAGDMPLVGPAAESLRQASGVEVWVSGSREDDGALAIAAYRVRAVDGMPATDGRLEVDGDDVVLVATAGDSVRFGPAPAALQALVGRHVWIAGQPGGEPMAWGTLDAP